MSSELAPPLPAAARRRAEIERIRVTEQQIARLQLAQRHAIAALVTAPGGAGERFVADELALACARSPRQGQHRVAQALGFGLFPAVHALVADGTWFLDHADAVVDELARSGLGHAAQEQVLELVLSRPGVRTPHELRVAVRTAVLALFPDHAWQQADKARTDRNVTVMPAGPGAAQLIVYGPTEQIAAMNASIDALCWPVAADDHRSLAQRRFDAIKQLACGQAQPGQWQVQLIAELTTALGHDDQPAEIIGMGPVPAQVARELAASGELRRVVVDEHGRLVAVDSMVHRPDLDVTVREPYPVYPDDDNHPEPVEPDPHAPSAADLAWLEEQAARENYDPQACQRDRQTAPRKRSRAQDLDRAAHDLLPAPRAAEPEQAETHHTGREQAARTAPTPTVSLQLGASPLEVYGQGLPRRTVGISVQHGAGAVAVLDDPTTTAEDAATSSVEATAPAAQVRSDPLLPARWSPTAFSRAIQKIRTDPVVVVDLRTDRYRPTRRLARHLEARDRTCVFPGCPRLARICDLDHVIVWPLGPTSEVNLANECEHHHQAKHHGFGLIRLPDGTFRWTTPAGHTYDRPPRPVLDNPTRRPPPTRPPPTTQPEPEQ